MEKSTNNIRPVHIICYVISFICLILLFFTNRWEPEFHDWMKHSPLSRIFGLTVNKFVLFLLNLSMFISIISPLKNEDERVEKIKNYVFIHTFIGALGVGIMLGLFLKIDTSLLMYIALTLAYYILIFHICLYRDSSIVYMSKEELKVYGLETNMRFKSIVFILPILTFVIVHYFMVIAQRGYDLIIPAVMCVCFLYFLIRAVYMHWAK